MYGKELIIDLKNCDVTKFNRVDLKNYFDRLCKLIKMTQCELHFWDDENTPEEKKQTLPHTVGTSAIQFIITSNVTIHSLDLLGHVYINIFSCKDFYEGDACDFTKEFFKGEMQQYSPTVVFRGAECPSAIQGDLP